jgi:conjugative transfer signal peptidase TraF
MNSIASGLARFSRPARWRILRTPLLLGGSMAGVLLLAGLLGYRINFSASEPVGLWQVHAPSGLLQVGDYVSFCAPVAWYPFLTKGDCPNGAKPFLKQVAGVPGDIVVVKDAGVWIDGRKLPDSAPLSRAISMDVSLPQWRGVQVLPRDAYWMYGTGWPRRSFDSRYWGPLPRSQIISIAQPVLVWTSAH